MSAVDSVPDPAKEWEEAEVACCSAKKISNHWGDIEQL